MEVVAAAASILSVASAGLKIAQTLYEIADAVKSGGERLRTLSSHVEDSAAVIEEVGNTLREEESAKKRVVSQPAINSAKNCTGRCSAIFSEIEERINEARKNDLKTWFFPLREPLLQKLESELQAKIGVLHVLLQCIIAARCRATDLQSQEILQRMRIQAAIDARNASIKTAEAWQEDMTEKNPITDIDFDSDITLLYPGHQHDKDPNSIGTEQQSGLHLVDPSKQDPPPWETEHGPINKAPSDKPDFMSVFSSALFVVCCPCFAANQRQYDSDGQARPSGAGNKPSLAEFSQYDKDGGDVTCKPPRIPDGTTDEAYEDPIVLKSSSRARPDRREEVAQSREAPVRHVISGSARRRQRADEDKAPTWSEPSEQLQTVDDLLRFWTTAYEDSDDGNTEKSME